MDIGFAIRYYWNRVFWRIARPLRSAYRFFTRGKARAVKVLIRDGENILLARINYGHRNWTLPGGAVERNESYENAARREIMEELGLDLSTLKEIGEYLKYHDFRNVTVKAFEATPASLEPKPDGIEIREAKWFSIDSLPAGRPANIDVILDFANQARGR